MRQTCLVSLDLMKLCSSLGIFHVTNATFSFGLFFSSFFYLLTVFSKPFLLSNRYRLHLQLVTMPTALKIFFQLRQFSSCKKKYFVIVLLLDDCMFYFILVLTAPAKWFSRPSICFIRNINLTDIFKTKRHVGQNKENYFP